MLKWSIISGLMKLKVAQIVSFFPIFGYLIIFNDNLVEYLEGSGGFYISFEQKVYLIYFGSLLLCMSYILYLIFCPGIIKKHADALDYAANLEDAASADLRARIILENASAFFPFTNKIEKKRKKSKLKLKLKIY